MATCLRAHQPAQVGVSSEVSGACASPILENSGTHLAQANEVLDIRIRL